MFQGNNVTSVYSGGSSPMAPGNRQFGDPFLVPSWSVVPEDLRSIFDICQFLYIRTPEWANAAERTVSYFLTDIEFVGNKSGDKREQDEVREYLRDQVGYWGHQQELGNDWACFAGETLVPTRDGVYQIKDLVGRTVDVLSQGGKYRPAEFKTFGRQKLMEVEFSDGRKVYATPEHQWVVKNCSNAEVRIPTTALRTRHRIKRTVASRPKKNAEYREGVRHGFIFGDGSLSNSKRRHSSALFCGTKDLAMLPHFAGHHNPAIQRTDRKEMLRMHGFPPEYKMLPAADRSASYWYGFVSGFLAADGHVDKRDGCTVLTQKRKWVLEAISAQLPRLGMCGGPVKHGECTIDMRKLGGKDPARKFRMHYLTLLKRFMQPGDFLIPQHRANFEKNPGAGGAYGEYVGIAAVRATERVESVYCCVEPETHTFVVDNGILTGNCYGNAFGRMHFPFYRFLLVPTQNGIAEIAVDSAVGVKYNYLTMKYTIDDPTTTHMATPRRRRIEVDFIDRRSRDINRIRFARIDPRYVYIRHAIRSTRSWIIERFEPLFLASIKRGDLWQVNETPMSVLEAISKNADFLYDEDQIFHLKKPTISGVSNTGWGLPGVLSNFSNLHQLAVLRRVDEAVGLDYMMPFRIISPNMGTGDLNSFANSGSMGVWSAMLQQMVANKRIDPYAIHTAPFPIDFQEVGATGKTLTPKENMEWTTNALLNAGGFPAELFTSTLTYQQVPTAMRLFESTWQFMANAFNRHLKWAMRQIRDANGQEQMSVQVRQPSFIDDIEARHIYLQLAAGGEFPRSKAFEPWGVRDPVQAAIDRAKEDAEIQKGVAKVQADAAQESGSMLSGGGAGGAPGGASYTPADRARMADDKAKELLQIQFDGDRAKALQQLKATDPELHALVKQKMEEYRSTAKAQGGQQVSQMVSA